jgi:hypothetical protein
MFWLKVGMIGGVSVGLAGVIVGVVLFLKK